MSLNGEIIAGEFDQQTEEFILQKVKHLSTETTLNEKQLMNLTDYLSKKKHDPYGQVLTLYDQILVRLNQEEVEQFLNDLDNIKSLYY